MGSKVRVALKSVTQFATSYKVKFMEPSAHAHGKGRGPTVRGLVPPDGEWQARLAPALPELFSPDHKNRILQYCIYRYCGSTRV